MRSVLGFTLSVVLAAFLAVAAQAEPIQPPKVGQKGTYDCTSTHGGTYTYVVRSVEDGDVHYRFTGPNSDRLIVMPMWFLGTSLFKSDQGTGYGNAEMTSGLDKFDGLRSLRVGDVFRGYVKQTITGEQPIGWSYTIKVLKTQDISDLVLGQTTVVVIEEDRSAGSMSSHRTAWLSPKHAELAYAKYSDSQGRTRECHIKSRVVPQ
jgi:hypothetical protein